MSDVRYTIGDHVRASYVGSEILEGAVVKEIVEKWIGHIKTLDTGVVIEGPLYWICFDISGQVVPRWQNELVAIDVVAKKPVKCTGGDS